MLSRYWRDNTLAFEAFEKVFYTPLFEESDSRTLFSIDFLTQFITIIPRKFLAELTKCFRKDHSYNEELMTKWMKFTRSSPVFKVKSFCSVVEKLPVRSMCS